jgi:hypothetical protein
MKEELNTPEDGAASLFTKTLLVLYASLLALTSTRADAHAVAVSNMPDEDFAARFANLKRRPQLVLKLNLANLAASKAMMHTSHRSHSSHSSHYSSSSGGHSSHMSHSSHYSSSSYSGGSGGSSSSSYTPSLSPSYTPSLSPSYTPSYSPSYTPRSSARRRSSRSRSYSSTPTYSNSYYSVLTLGDRVLKLGDRGNDVQELQMLLLSKGYSVDADGTFGLGTNAAVKSFQRGQGLAADGVVGAQTIAALRGY